jgi:hypothetical protein
MKNFELMGVKAENIPTIGHMLCDMQFEFDQCEHCPVAENCFPWGPTSKNGFINWLEAEHEKKQR